MRSYQIILRTIFWSSVALGLAVLEFLVGVLFVWGVLHFAMGIL